LESPARLQAIAFDKTGTLTEGRLEVASLVPLDGHTDNELLARAAALESRSTHPLARAILAHAERRGVVVEPADGVALIAGRGATGRVGGREFWVGSHAYLEEKGQETAEVHQLLEELGAQGGSVVVVGNERHVCGAIVLSDRIRDESRASLEQLQGLGVRNLVLLTGDNQTTARGVGARLGVTDVRAELLPEAKVQAVRELVQRVGATAMVGDGVNDAPALAAATVGIAMGSAGSDAAIETADIALMSDDLRKLPWLVRHSRRAVGVIRQNIAFALLVKAVFVALAFAGRATLWSAIAADMGASLLVIFNALRLLRAAPANPQPTR
ncbi:MAG: putative cadmium-transporting ATPase, partial [Actinomycetota bacterium]